MSLQAIHQILVRAKEKISKASACILLVCPVFNGVEVPSRILRFVTFVHLPFSFRYLDLSLFHMCLGGALYLVLLVGILSRVELSDSALANF